MKNSKKLLIIALAAMMLLSLAACGGTPATQSPVDTSSSAPETPEDSPSAPANRLEQILANGVLTVATSPDFPPYEFVDPNLTGQGSYVGCDMELARYIADAMGVTLDIQAMDFSACQTAVSAGRVDISVSGYSYTEERAENMELSKFYNLQDGGNTQGVLVLAGEAGNYTSVGDFEGKTVAAQNGSLQYNLASTYLEGAKIELITDIKDGVTMLLAGKIDAIAIEIINGEAFIANNDGLEMANFEFDFQDEGTVVIAQKGETELIERVNEILDTVNAENLYPTWKDEAVALSQSLGLDAE